MKSELLKNYVLQQDGYKILKTHFKIGSKVHSSEFYYAKHLFQNSYYTSRIAMLLARRIREKIGVKGKPLLLVGYEAFSELLLSLTEQFLRDLGWKEIKHVTVEDIDGKVGHEPKDVKLVGSIVIIVPIASTGSTAVKIEQYIREVSKDSKLDFVAGPYNVIVAKAKTDIENTRTYTNEQVSMIELSADWQDPATCTWCYDKNEYRPLLETDKSSLTPDLLFTLPTSKEHNDYKINEVEIEAKDFKREMFTESLLYRTVIRNDEHFLFSMDTDKFIENNADPIKLWLKELDFRLNNDHADKTKRTIILAPSHYSNARFINLVNDKLFGSSATIIHFDPKTDHASNFKLLHEKLFKAKDIRVFFVDDSIITGRNFFAIYDLFRFTTEYVNSQKFAAAIFLSNKSSPDVTKRVERATVQKYYSFINLNLPISPRVSKGNPLEQEAKRYEELSNLLLHDILKNDYAIKASDLRGEGKTDLQSLNSDNGNKKERHLLMFEATHKAYTFFSKKDLSISEISFKHLLDELGFNEEKGLIVLKVLSQYPFILYKSIREKTFSWYLDIFNKTIDELLQPSGEIKMSYEQFRLLKFLLRRAVFLKCYNIVDGDFFKLLEKIFLVINKILAKYSKLDLSKDDLFTKPLKNEAYKYEQFHYFLLRQYIEIIHGNPWCVVKIVQGITEARFSTNAGKRFERMLRIEAATILKEYCIILLTNRKWSELYANLTSRIEDKIHQYVRDIKKHEDNSVLIEFLNTQSLTNKLDVCTRIMDLKTSDAEYKSQFIHFLWVKQFIDFDKEHGVPEMSLRNKTEIVFGRIKQFFLTPKDVGAFFIVTDGMKQPHLVYDQGTENGNFLGDLDNESHKLILEFLKGENIKSSGFQNESEQIKKTIIEYRSSDDGYWFDIYEDEAGKIEIPFLLKQKWLMLIRISDQDMGTLGLMGFYSTVTLEGDILAKQLLMVIREDIGLFITKHHQTDEFAALREAETVKRFAYLAGHGRQMMQKLANKNSMFSHVINTLSKIQYLFATTNIGTLGNASYLIDESTEELLLKIFTKKSVNAAQVEIVEKIGNEILESDLIENVVHEKWDVVHNLNGRTFRFDSNIFVFICFELLVNAKKNRYHFLDDLKCDSCSNLKNYFKLNLELGIDEMLVKLVGTGPPVPGDLIDKIDYGLPVKKDSELSGIYLINKVIKHFDKDNDLKIVSKIKCRVCNFTENTMILKLQPLKS